VNGTVSQGVQAQAGDGFGMGGPVDLASDPVDPAVISVAADAVVLVAILAAAVAARR